jgi:RimJ/RimL family protein N-acetyltransferase
MITSNTKENSMKIANSARLQFELMDENDAPLLFELDQDPVVMRFINGGRAATMDEIKNATLPRMRAYTNPAQGWGLWKVTTLASQLENPSCFIGWILVRPMGFFSDAPALHDIEIGWRFKQMTWGKGYATEAAKAILQMLAQQAEVSHVSAIVDTANLSSIGVMEKLGMQFLKRDSYPSPDGPEEMLCYQIAV